jgi:hypothetical protein
MRRGKVRAITIVVTAAMLALTLLPGAVLAHNFCQYVGAVVCCDNVTAVTAWLEDPYVGPWTATLEDTPYGLTVYRLNIPPDDPNTPMKDGGVLGDTVHFMVTCGSVNITAPSATGSNAYATGAFRQHRLDLCGGCPLTGDVNMDGVVNVGDIIVEKRIIKGLDPETPCADVDHDGHVDVGDIIKIKRIIKGIDC